MEKGAGHTDMIDSNRAEDKLGDNMERRYIENSSQDGVLVDCAV